MSVPATNLPVSVDVLSLIAAAEELARTGASRPAENLFRRALSISPAPSALNAYGCFLWSLCRYPDAAAQFCVLLEEAEQAGDAEWAATAANNLAAVCREWGEPRFAARAQQYALRLELRCSHSGTTSGLSPTSLGNLAAEAIAAGEYGRAERLLWQSLLGEWAAGNLAGEAADWGNLGISAGLQGECGEAVVYFWRALRLHRRLRDRRGVGLDLLHLGQALSGLGLCQAAGRVFLRAKEWLERAGLDTHVPIAVAGHAESLQHRRVAGLHPQRN